jgi:hypothetical protein
MKFDVTSWIILHLKPQESCLKLPMYQNALPTVTSFLRSRLTGYLTGKVSNHLTGTRHQEPTFHLKIMFADKTRLISIFLSQVFFANLGVGSTQATTTSSI